MDDPARLEENLSYWLRLVAGQATSSLDARLSARGISSAQWIVLRSLYDRQPCSLGELAQVLSADEGALSRMIQRLVQKKLVSREIVPTNRRAVTLSLSPEGMALVPGLAEDAGKNDETFFAPLSRKERAEFLQSLKTLVVANQGDLFGSSLC